MRGYLQVETEIGSPRPPEVSLIFIAMDVAPPGMANVGRSGRRVDSSPWGLGGMVRFVDQRGSFQIMTFILHSFFLRSGGR